MKMKIAVCEDNAVDLKIISDILNEYLKTSSVKFTFDVFETFDGCENNQEDYDLFILDYMMPGKNGLDFARELYDKFKTSKTVIFITAYPEIVYDSFEVNTFRFLVKPLDKVKFDCSEQRRYYYRGQHRYRQILDKASAEEQYHSHYCGSCQRHKLRSSAILLAHCGSRNRAVHRTAACQTGREISEGIDQYLAVIIELRSVFVRVIVRGKKSFRHNHNCYGQTRREDVAQSADADIRHLPRRKSALYRRKTRYVVVSGKALIS